MVRQAFCSSCMRTVYRGTDETDSCPVCSSPLVVTEAKAAVEHLAPPKTAAPVPANEDLRLAAVKRYEILDSPPDGAFDRITRIGARIFEVPICTITVVDHDRIWFKSKHGVDADEIGRDPGLCASALINYEPLVINDATLDPVALENPLVRGDLGLRFYAGAPLTTADGYNLGTLNIIDKRPRELTAEDIEMLAELAELVVDELELRLAAIRLQREAAELGVRLGEKVPI